MITGIAHINLLVPIGTLDQAEAFYGKTLGLTPRPGPEGWAGRLAWFDIGTSGQQVHIAFGENENLKSSRHPCFKIESPGALQELKQKVWEHHLKGDAAGPKEADEPGAQNSGNQGKGYPTRFFARDYAGNRLEFSL